MGCERDVRPVPESEQRRAQVTLFNATHEVLPVNRQTVHSDYVVACGLVAHEPDRFLTLEHLTGVQEDHLLSGVETSLAVGSSSASETSSHCVFSFLETPDGRLPPVATAWTRNLEQKVFYGDVDAPADVSPDPPALLAEAIYDGVASGDLRPWRDRPCGGDLAFCDEDELTQALRAPVGAAYNWSVLGEFPTLRPFNPHELIDVAVEDQRQEGLDCRTGRENTPLYWDNPPSGSWRILSVVETPMAVDEEGELVDFDEDHHDDPWRCWDATLERDDSSRSWIFCGSRRMAQLLESRYKRGYVVVEFFQESQSGPVPGAYEALTIGLQRRTDEGELFETETIEAVQGYGIPEHFGLQWSASPRTSCDARREVPSCDQIILPARLQIETSGGQLTISPGESHYLAPEANRRIELVRGIFRAVSDLRCDDVRTGPQNLRHPGAYLELLYFGGPTILDLD